MACTASAVLVAVRDQALELFADDGFSEGRNDLPRDALEHLAGSVVDGCAKLGLAAI
jgi:hypothetical protein